MLLLILYIWRKCKNVCFTQLYWHLWIVSFLSRNKTEVATSVEPAIITYTCVGLALSPIVSGAGTITQIVLLSLKSFLSCCSVASLISREMLTSSESDDDWCGSVRLLTLPGKRCGQSCCFTWFQSIRVSRAAMQFNATTIFKWIIIMRTAALDSC